MLVYKAHQCVIVIISRKQLTLKMVTHNQTQSKTLLRHQKDITIEQE